jgi:hypothetical protein
MQQRGEIAARFDRVYNELNILAQGGAEQFKNTATNRCSPKFMLSAAPSTEC